MMKFLLLFLLSTTVYGNQKIIDHLKKNTRTAIVSANFRSYDLNPITSQHSRNFFINNLYFEAPLRYTPDGDITSRVLKKFTSRNGIVTFELGDAKFMDGSKIRPKDIVLTIKRKLALAPKKPLTLLKGYKKWSQSKYPIEEDLEGINIEGNKIIFEFSTKLGNYYNWATDSSVGITKVEYINTKNGNLIGTPPPSGSFKVSKVDFPLVMMSGKYDLTIAYVNINNIEKYLEHLKSNHLVFTDSGYMTPKTRSELKNSKNIVEFSQDRNRFESLMLSSNKKPFEKRRVRQYFAKELRNTIKKLGGKPEGSIITELYRGYLSLESLEKDVEPFSEKEIKEILSDLGETPIIPTLRTFDSCMLYLKETAERLKIKLKPKAKNSIANVACIYSGLDMIYPAEEFSAFLSLGRFNLIDDYLRDAKLRDLVNKMDLKKPKTAQEVNRYLFKESFLSGIKINEITHFVTKDSKIKKLTKRMTSLDDYF